MSDHPHTIVQRTAAALNAAQEESERARRAATVGLAGLLILGLAYGLTAMQLRGALSPDHWTYYAAAVAVTAAAFAVYLVGARALDLRGREATAVAADRRAADMICELTTPDAIGRLPDEQIQWWITRLNNHRPHPAAGRQDTRASDYARILRTLRDEWDNRGMPNLP